MTVAFRVANPGLCKLGLALSCFMQVLDMTIACDSNKRLPNKPIKFPSMRCTLL